MTPLSPSQIPINTIAVIVASPFSKLNGQAISRNGMGDLIHLQNGRTIDAAGDWWDTKNNTWSFKVKLVGTLFEPGDNHDDYESSAG